MIIKATKKQKKKKDGDRNKCGRSEQMNERKEIIIIIVEDSFSMHNSNRK